MSIGLFYSDEHYYFVKLNQHDDHFDVLDSIELSEPINLRKRFRQQKVYAAMSDLSVLHRTYEFDSSLKQSVIEKELIHHQEKYFSLIHEPLIIKVKQTSDSQYDFFAIRQSELDKLKAFIKQTKLSLCWVEPESQARMRLSQNQVAKQCDYSDSLCLSIGCAIRGFYERN